MFTGTVCAWLQNACICSQFLYVFAICVITNSFCMVPQFVYDCKVQCVYFVQFVYNWTVMYGCPVCTYFQRWYTISQFLHGCSLFMVSQYECMVVQFVYGFTVCVCMVAQFVYILTFFVKLHILKHFVMFTHICVWL